MVMLQEVEGLEIVFISSDRSPEDMTSYMKESHGDWVAVPHNSTVANDLKQKYGNQMLILLIFTFCPIMSKSNFKIKQNRANLFLYIDKFIFKQLNDIIGFLFQVSLAFRPWWW